MKCRITTLIGLDWIGLEMSSKIKVQGKHIAYFKPHVDCL